MARSMSRSLGCSPSSDGEGKLLLRHTARWGRAVCVDVVAASGRVDLLTGSVRIGAGIHAAMDDVDGLRES